MKNTKTKIIATIGPVSGNIKIVRGMIKNGVNFIRLNMSYRNYPEDAKFISTVRKAAELEKKDVKIILDLSGPRMKTKTGHGLDQKVKGVITKKDKEDLAFGFKEGVDMFAMSYVKNGKDVADLKKLMMFLGEAKPIIAKIERKDALKNIEGIIKESDMVMVARGDLGDALPYEKVPFIQNEIIKKCNKSNKPVIVATEMMLSMKYASRPTRAEVTDVANAVLEGANILMLSNETGSKTAKYPVETVKAMKRIIVEAEKHIS